MLLFCTDPIAYALDFLDCKHISAHCVLSIFPICHQSIILPPRHCFCHRGIFFCHRGIVFATEALFLPPRHCFCHRGIVFATETGTLFNKSSSFAVVFQGPHRLRPRLSRLQGHLRPLHVVHLPILRHQNRCQRASNAQRVPRRAASEAHH